MDNFCPVCLKKGIKNRIELIQINLDEALLMCKAEKCMWPFGYEDFTFVPRVAGKIWSCYWDTYKRNMLVSKESVQMNSVHSTPKIETISCQGNALPQSLAETNASLSCNSSGASFDSAEPVFSLTKNNLGNATGTLQTDTHSVPCSEDISIVTQNIVIQPTRKVNPSKRNIGTGKRYEKFSFSTLKGKNTSSPSVNTNNLPSLPLIQESNNDNKNNVSNSDKSISNNSKYSINSNDTKDTNGDNTSRLLSTINCQVDIIVPEISTVKSGSGETLPTLVSTSENNVSVNIDCLLNEYLTTNSVSSKDTCDDWLDDLINSTAI